MGEFEEWFTAKGWDARTYHECAEVWAAAVAAERNRVINAIESRSPDGRSVNWSIYDGARAALVSELLEDIRS